jgi:hypothetical protein
MANDNLSILSLPCDLHGLVYSYLEWEDKLIFISLSKEISSLSKELSRDETRQALLSQIFIQDSFRDRVCTLVLPCHIDLNLSSWDGERNPTTDECLYRLRDVRCLRLSYCGGFTDAGLAYLRNLNQIYLCGCHQITDEGLRHLGNLESLNLSDCRGITDVGLMSLKKLKEIILYGCRQITDEGLRHLGNLQYLDLSSEGDQSLTLSSGHR